MKSYGTMIRDRRKALKLTQRKLAAVVGCSDSYITHLEKEEKVPSSDMCIALARELGLKTQEQEEFFKAVEMAYSQRNERRLLSRRSQLAEKSSVTPKTSFDEQTGHHPTPITLPPSAGIFQTRGAGDTQSGGPSAPEIGAEEIACDLTNDPDLRVAYQQLKTALADPQMRQVVLQAVQAFAAQASTQEHESR